MQHRMGRTASARSVWRWAATLALLITLLGGSFTQVAPASAAAPKAKDDAKPNAVHPHAPARQGANAAAVTPGNLYGWGYNYDGEVGDGTYQYDEHYVPVQTVGISNVTDVAAGYYATLAASADGSAYGWGDNSSGQLGIGDTSGNEYDYPMQLVAPGDCPAAAIGSYSNPGACGYMTNVVAVASGYEHGLVLRGDGTVYAFGYNRYGALGSGVASYTAGPDYVYRPQQVVGPNGTGFLTDIIAIQAGDDFSVALKRDGTVYAWGYNNYGELGNGTMNTTDCECIPYPVQVLGPGGVGFLTDVKAIAVGEYGDHVLALKNDGTVFAWGYNSDGELGNGTFADSAIPVPVLGGGGSGVRSIAAGEYHSLATRTDGTVYAWGDNGYGQLGNGTDGADQPVPAQVLAPDGVGFLSGIAQVGAGGSTSAALTTDGRLYAWGYNDDGEVGDGLYDAKVLIPHAVRNANGPGQLSGISFVDVGYYHVMAIASATATPSATSLTFGNQTVGTTSVAQSVTLTNGGGGPLTITGTTSTGANAGDFAQNGGCAGVVQAGGTCTVNVTFAPTATGVRAATLSFATNAGQVDVALSGTGVVTLVTHTVTAAKTGSGTVSAEGVTNYNDGDEAVYTATPAAGQVFLGWTLDGVYVGYASPLNFTVSANRTLVATFVARPTFGDIGGLSAQDQQAITFLAALGIINPNGVNGSGQFQPGTDVKRAEMAAFVARVFAWQKEFHANTFPDKCDANGENCVDDELWNNVAALKDYGIVGGYNDPQTCAGAGTTTPCYLPRDTVQRLQVVSIVARAFIKQPDLRPTGFWDRLNADNAQYTNVPNTGTQRSDLTTYRANVGTVPGQASDANFGDPNGNGTRLYTVQVLYAAFNAQFGVDRVP